MQDHPQTHAAVAAIPCLHTLFEAQAARTPDALAVQDGDDALSYADLDAAAERLAAHLRAAGVGPERIVALCLERSLDLPLAVLATLKAGGAYLPLDPAHPSARLREVLEEAAPVLVLTDSEGAAALAAASPDAAPVAAVRVDGLARADAQAWEGVAGRFAQVTSARHLAAADGDVAPGHPAYVIYTSGSTGRPKGVVVEHRQLAAVAAAWPALYGLAPGSRYLQMASASFDVFAADLVRAWSAGGCVVLCPRVLLGDGAGLYAFMRGNAIAFADFVPAVLDALLDAVEAAGGDLHFLHAAVCGSDLWTPRSAQRLRRLCAPGARLYNAYGLTEAAVDTTHHALPEDAGAIDASRAAVPIGKPLPGVAVLLLDAELRPVPQGESGEIVIGGPGVARGYLHRPELTAERFIDTDRVGGLDAATRAQAGPRLYRSGDLGRFDADGCLHFLGRNDHQIKLRGLRVEPGEIEAALAALPGVHDALVMLREDDAAQGGAARLVAYVRVDDPAAAPAPQALREALAARLPEHMVPAAYVALAAWPLNANRKRDRKALPAPGPEHLATRPYRAPEGETETALAALWSALLGGVRVGRDDGFLDLGGDSLRMVQLGARIRERFGAAPGVAALFRARDLAAMAVAVDAASAEDDARAQTADGFDACALDSAQEPASLPPATLPSASHQQQALWVLEQVSTTALAYNSQNLFRIRGEIDRDRLQQALDDLVARHEILRTSFHAGPDDVLRMRVHPQARAELLYREPDGELDDAAFMALLESEVQRAFVLTELPLVRWILVRRRVGEYALVHVEHHYVHDGWTANLALRELLALYAWRSGEGPEPPPPPAQYRDYTRWQHDVAAHSLFPRQLAWWKQRLQGAPESSALPSDFPRPPQPAYHGELIPCELPPALVARLQAFCRARGITPYAALLAVYQIVFGRFIGRERFLVGSAMANRKARRQEGMLGMFVNMVTLVCDTGGAPAFETFAQRVMEELGEAFEYEETPFQLVVREVQANRRLGENPLFQTAFNYHNSDLPELRGPGFEIELQEVFNNRTSKFDFDVIMVPRGLQRRDTITMFWTYATELYRRQTLERLIAAYVHVLEQCMDAPATPVDALRVLSPQDEAQLRQWSMGGGVGHAPAAPTLHGLVSSQVVLHAEAVALSQGAEQWSYAQLERWSDGLAQALLARGAGAGTRVAVLQARGCARVASALAVLKAGAAYVPLDASYPAERLGFMLADAAPVLTLTDAACAEAFALARACAGDGGQGPQGCPALAVDAVDWTTVQAERPLPVVPADAPAYVIYTSGSTGRPKGVVVAHGGAVQLAQTQAARLEIGPEGRVLQFAAFGFDASVFEWVLALCHGARLCMPAVEEVLVGETLETVVAREGTTHALLPPVALASLPAQARLASLRVLVSGGEALSSSLASRWRVGRRLFNAYGPTEDTVVSTLHACETDESPIPIGRPLPGHRAYVLDERMRPVPVGVSGELYVGGAGVALGYLNRPTLTGERFLPSPFEQGERLYRTGDVVRWRADGVLEYQGRNDDQVKLRGYRIEPGEIAAALESLPGVEEALVQVRADVPGSPERQLVAYWRGAAQPQALHAALSSVLPAHQVPAAYVRVDAWPVTANGKVDRTRLPAPKARAGAESSSYVAPRNPMEEALTALWAEHLGVMRVGVRDNFFRQGGHSLLGIRLIAAVNAAFGTELELRHLFDRPTVEGLLEAMMEEVEADA